LSLYIVLIDDLFSCTHARVFNKLTYLFIYLLTLAPQTLVADKLNIRRIID